MLKVGDILKTGNKSSHKLTMIVISVDNKRDICQYFYLSALVFDPSSSHTLSYVGKVFSGSASGMKWLNNNTQI